MPTDPRTTEALRRAIELLRKSDYIDGEIYADEARAELDALLAEIAALEARLAAAEADTERLNQLLAKASNAIGDMRALARAALARVERGEVQDA